MRTMRFIAALTILAIVLSGQGGAQKRNDKSDKFRADMVVGKARSERRTVIINDLADTLSKCFD